MTEMLIPWGLNIPFSLFRHPLSALHFYFKEGDMSEKDVKKMKAILLSLLFLPLFVMISFLSFAEAEEAVGKFTYVEGQVDLLKGGGLPAVSVKVGDPVYVKDIVRTKSDSKAEITFVDNSVLRIGQRSRIDVSEYGVEEGRRHAVIRLPRGKVQAIVPEERVKRISISPEANRFEIHTPNAVAGVRGTDYFVFQERNVTGIFVLDGTVCVYNHKFMKDIVCVPLGYMTFIDPYQRPLTPRPATEGEMRRFEKETALFGTTASTGVEPRWVFANLVLTPPPLTEVTTTPPITENPEVLRLILVPSIEVGRTNLSGSLIVGSFGSFDYVSVFLNNVIFLAPSTGEKPAIWQTNSVTGQYNFSNGYLTPGNITNPNNVIIVTNGNGISADFQFTLWDIVQNIWNANINNGTGNLKGGSYNGPVTFSGDATGKIGPGTLIGSAKGKVK